MASAFDHRTTVEQQDRKILVLYGTETGNSQERAEELGRLCERLHFQTLVEEMDDVKLSDLLRNYKLVIFVISTTGQGHFPANTKLFWKSLRRAKLPPGCLVSLRFTTFGLGDSSYSKFNWAARQLHSRLQQLGANEAFPRGEADERHDNGIDSIYQPWCQDLRAYLLAEFPLPNSLSPIPDDEPLPPKYILRLAPTMDGTAALKPKGSVASIQEQADERQFLANREKNAALSHIENPRSAIEQFDADWDRQRTNKNIPFAARQNEAQSYRVLNGQRVDSLDKDNILKDSPEKYLIKPAPAAKETLPPAILLPIPGGVNATVVSNIRVTPKDHWQDVRLLPLQLHLPEADKDVAVSPGNTVVIYPKNFPEDVQTLIDLMDWNDVADKVVEFDLLWPTRSPDKAGLSLMPKRLFAAPCSTLRDLLTHNFDITAVPTRSFLGRISHYAGDAIQKARLLELIQFENSQEFYDLTSRPRRTILELLRDFRSVKIPFHVVPDLFPIIRGREFSNTNGGDLLTSGRSNVICLEILVALVEYKTVIRKPRQGLCSRYIKHLPAGTMIRVGFKYGDPPPHGVDFAERPLVAIAAGTGIAPIRSLIYERTKYSRRAPTLLFFGCRNKDADFHYHEDWNNLEEVTVIPAFSRDPKPEGSDEGELDRYSLTINQPTAGSTGLPPIDATTTGMLSYDYDRGKTYVQHLIRRYAKEVCQMFAQGAIICLCGNSGRMPASVRQALIDAAVLGGYCRDVEEAKDLFDEKNPNRLIFWQETW